MKARQRSSFMRKVNWLLEHQAVWEGFPSQDKTQWGVFAALQKAGLYSEQTLWSDAGVERLISKARAIRRNMQRAEAEAILPRRVQERIHGPA